MDPASPLLIHEVLPSEILAMVFENHAKLEWRAPAIDGRVCRLWRQIVLNAPRAWAYLEICNYRRRGPSKSNLLLWLDRSCTAPLHIRVEETFLFGWSINDSRLYCLLFDYHARIASLRMGLVDLAFFEGRDFPRMRLLDVRRWYRRDYSSHPVQWGRMPKLRSLYLGPTNVDAVPLDSPPPLKTLVLHIIKCTSLSRHSPSLVTLMLHTTRLKDAISGPMDFPSLTHLALFGVRGLKPHINAPYLVTYYESGCMIGESFSAPIPSLVEYGVCGIDKSLDSAPTEWHRSFPNIQKLFIRAEPFVHISLLHSLATHPHSLPALQMISSGSSRIWGEELAKSDQETMESLIQARSEACLRDIALCFELGQPLHIAPSYVYVSHCLIGRPVIF